MDILHVSAVVMVLRVFVALLVSVYFDGHMRADYAALFTALRDVANVRYAECVKLFERGLLIFRKLQEGGCEHISRRAHGAVKVNCFHIFSRYYTK